MNNDQRKAIDLHYNALIEALAIGSSPLFYFRANGTLNDEQLAQIQSVNGTPKVRASGLLQLLRVVDKGWQSLIDYLKENNMSLVAKKLEDSLYALQKDTQRTTSDVTVSTDEKSAAVKEAMSAPTVSVETNSSFRMEQRGLKAELRLKHSVFSIRTKLFRQPGPKECQENSGTGVLVQINLNNCLKCGILTGYKMFSYHRPYCLIVIILEFPGLPSLASQPFQFELDDNAYVFACEFLNCSFAELKDDDVTRLMQVGACRFLNVHPSDLGLVQASTVFAANAYEISKQSDAMPFNNVFHFYSNVRLQIGSPVVDHECNIVGMFTDHGWHLFYNSTATMSSYIIGAIARDYESSTHSKTPLPRLVLSLSTDVVNKLENCGLLNINGTNTTFIQTVNLSPCRFVKAVELMFGASAYRKIRNSNSVVTINNRSMRMLPQQTQQISQQDNEKMLMAIKAFLLQYNPTLRNFMHIKVECDLEWLLTDLVAILKDLVDSIILSADMIAIQLSAITKKEELESYRFKDNGGDNTRTLCSLLKHLNLFFYRVQERDAWLPANQQTFAVLSGLRELLFIDLCIIYSQAAVMGAPRNVAGLELVETVQHHRTHHSWYWRTKYTFHMGYTEVSSPFLGPWHRQDVFPESESERHANHEVYEAIHRVLALLKMQHA